MRIDLTGKVALVTGASRGIGRAIALALGGAGAAVAVNYCESAALAEAVVREIEVGGGKALAFGADVGQPRQVDAMVGEVVSRLGQIDILVNNAGVLRDRLLLEMEDQDWEKVFRTNVGGVYYCTRAVVRGMILKRWGRIINLSSISATRGRKGQSNYAASKGAIEAFTRSLAAELGPKGVTANAIAPGLIVTDMTREILPFAEKVVEERVALKRPGQPGDVAPVAVFLASDQAAYITGQVIGVDGGMG